MTEAIAHRGPDGEGHWINEKGIAGLGNRRLAIIDLSDAASQPMQYLNRYTITYNGEIYNYVEVREELKKRGYIFASASDTEVILAAYDCYKENCLQYFDGMFAFAIWDEEEQTLFTARDRFGEKPFYYYKDEEQFLFASEIKALFAAGVKRKIKDSMLLNYLGIGQMQNPNDLSETFCENIFALPRSHFIKVNGKQLTVNSKQYYDIDKEKQIDISQENAIEKFTELFTISVKRRLRSDVKVGTSLSGGLDSSSVVAFIQRQTINYKLQTFSAVFPGFVKDETAHIKKVTSTFHLENFTTTPTAQSLIDEFDKLIQAQDEPFQSSSIYAQYKVYELAKQHNIKVLLDGQGADEILAGYHIYYHWYWQELLRNSFSDFKKEKNKTQQLNVNAQWSFKNYLAAFLPRLTSSHIKNKALHSITANSNLQPDFIQHAFDTHSIHKPVVKKLNDILFYNTMQLGLQDLLRFADRNSMADGVEIRLPFLNHEFVEFIFSLPSHYKIRNGFTKWILRKATENKLPKEIVWRTDKIGYEPPQEQWMQEPLMQQYIHSAKQKLVDEKILKSAVLNHPIQPKAAHDADNFDWRYLCAAAMF